MDYEKKYKEALERAKEINNEHKAQPFNIMTKVFPELRESKDEKMRKELIEHIKANECADYVLFKKFSPDDVIAWLEKQETSYTQRDVDNAYIEGMAFAKHELEKQGEATYQIRKDIATFIFNYRGVIKDRAKWMDYLGIKVSFVKKQGEQKPTDMVEPKFKVGDWVVYNRDDYSREIIQVYDIRDGRYYFTDNVHFSWSIKECDEKSRLWTIQDAKDGDVLSNGKMIVIFKHFEDPSYRQHIVAHIGLDTNGDIQITDDTWNLGIDKAKPATKEQRDTLMKAMADAGWEFDFEKKELKKIHVIDEGKSEMDYCFTKMMNGEKVSPTWSEDDERICHAIICDIANDKSICKFEISKSICDEQINWLKSLKERIGG